MVKLVNGQIYNLNRNEYSIDGDYFKNKLVGNIIITGSRKRDDIVEDEKGSKRNTIQGGIIIEYESVSTPIIKDSLSIDDLIRFFKVDSGEIDGFTGGQIRKRIERNQKSRRRRLNRRKSQKRRKSH